MPNNKKLFCLDASPFFTHGCDDIAVFEENDDKKTAVCITANSCRSCWQLGHDEKHNFATIGEIRTINSLLVNPYLIEPKETISDAFNELD